MPAQRLDDRRFILRKKQRKAAVAFHIEAGRLHIITARQVFGAMLPRAADALRAAETQEGLPYGLWGCRCSPFPCGARDCSGLIYYGINVVTRSNLCGSSFGLAGIAREHNTIVDKQTALHTPGAIGIRNPWGDPNANGSNGHTWYCKGDGVHSVEEGGHATGCYEGQADKDNTGECIYIFWPGFDYTTQARRELDMIIQTVHIAPNGTAVPARYSKTNGQMEYWIITPDGKHLIGYNGASMDNDSEVGKTGVRQWAPQAIGGATILSAVYKPPNADDPHEGVAVALSDGRVLPGHFS